MNTEKGIIVKDIMVGIDLRRSIRSDRETEAEVDTDLIWKMKIKQRQD